MKASFLAAVAVLCVGAAMAQGPDSPGGGPGGGPGGHHESTAQQVDHLATALGLTDTQKTQVAAVLEAEHAQMKAQREAAEASGTRPSFEQMKAARAQRQQDMLAKLTPILTAAQLEKYKTLMSERGPPGGPH